MKITREYSAQWSKATRILNWVILGLLAVLFFIIYGNLAQDDAYITFRYARNIALGRGFVYNNNEWVLGTTTPLFTLLLALISYLSKLDVVRINTIISIVSLWVSAGLLYELRSSVDISGSFILALIFLTNPFLQFFMGMESYFLLMIFMLVIWAYNANKKHISGYFSGLLILIRYEMVFLLLIIVVWDYARNRKIPFWILPGIIPVFFWMVYATIVFQSPIPLSVSAKILAPRISFLFGGAVYWYMLLSKNPAGLLLVIFSLMGILGPLFFKWSFREFSLISIFSVIYLFVASLFAGSFPWYYAPLVPGFAMTVLLGVNFFSHSTTFVKWQLSENKIYILNKGLLYASAIGLLMIQLSFWRNDFVLYQNKIGDDRYPQYKQVSDWIKENATGEPSIATFEIGYLGYLTDIDVIDLAGLVTPGLLPWVGEGRATILTNAIRIYSPDYILLQKDRIEEIRIVEDIERYQIINTFMNGYLLYATKPLK